MSDVFVLPIRFEISHLKSLPDFLTARETELRLLGWIHIYGSILLAHTGEFYALLDPAHPDLPDRILHLGCSSGLKGGRETAIDLCSPADHYCK